MLKTMLATIDPKQAFNEPTDVYNRAANWALAGFENKMVRLSREEQKKLLGGYFGKGRISVEHRIDGWVICNNVTLCFGTDYGYNGVCSLKTLERID